MRKVSYELLVEGPDDSNAFYHLLKQHDIAPHARLFLEWIRRLFTDTCSERDT